MRKLLTATAIVASLYSTPSHAFSFSQAWSAISAPFSRTSTIDYVGPMHRPNTSTSAINYQVGGQLPDTTKLAVSKARRNSWNYSIVRAADGRRIAGIILSVPHYGPDGKVDSYEKRSYPGQPRQSYCMGCSSTTYVDADGDVRPRQ